MNSVWLQSRLQQHMVIDGRKNAGVDLFMFEERGGSWTSLMQCSWWLTTLPWPNLTHKANLYFWN